MFLEVNSIRGHAEVSPQLASCSYAIGWNPFVMVVPRSTMEMSNFQIDQKIAMRALFLNALKLGQSGGSQQICDIVAKIPSGRNPRAASAFTSHSTLARGGAPVTAINRRPWFNSTIAAGHFFAIHNQGEQGLNVKAYSNVSYPARKSRTLMMAIRRYNTALPYPCHKDIGRNQAPWFNFWGNGGIIKDADRRDAYLKVAIMIMLSSVGWKSPGFPLSFFVIKSGTNLRQKTMTDWHAWPMS